MRKLFEMRFYFSFFILLLVLIIIDLYSFKAIRTAIKKSKARKVVSIAYWLITLVLYVLVGSVLLNKPGQEDSSRYANIALIFASVLLLFVPKVVILGFHLFDDIQFLIRKLVGRKHPTGNAAAKSRRAFLTKTGIAVAALPFASILWGIVKGRFDFTVYAEKVFSKKLPKTFEGFKIVQFSDFHLGSLAGHADEVEKAVELMNEQEPDLIVFTGDMVNNQSTEMDEFVPILKKLKARYGKFSILGNHDYGDYSEWDTPANKQANLDRLIHLQKEAGFMVLRNESRSILINGESIQLVGLENWGQPPFPQYGDLMWASRGIDPERFTLLLSHDPSHWDAEVLGKTSIDLTLAGHTHGMQFGIDIPGFKFSPVQWKYPRWAGLYTEGEQHLYVNRGIGYIGVAARVGMSPEITVLELCRG